MEKDLYLKIGESFKDKKLREDIKEITHKRLLELYQQNIPKNIQERYEYELNSIIENKFENIYMLLYYISKKVKEDNEYFLLSGTIGSSFIVYLLGITDIDPIKYNIHFETSSAIEGYRRPNFELVFSMKYLNKIKRYIEVILKENDMLTDETSDDGLKLYLRGNTDLDFVLRLEKLTDKKYTTILQDDKESLEVLKNANTLGISEFDYILVRNMILEIKPNSFEDFVKISGLSHGTDVWTNNAQELIKNETATLNEVIACRDDIMNYLIEQGADRHTAFSIMEFVRKGRANKDTWIEQWQEYKTKMLEYNIPDWYIKSCEKIKYLFPRAHAVNYVMNSFRLAYYKVHYPKEFYKTYFEVKVSEKFDFTLLNNKEELIKAIEGLNERTITNENELDYELHFLKKDYEVALEMIERGIKI